MAKAFHCRDVGVECGFTAKGGTEQEVMAEAEQHAKSVHGMACMPTDMKQKVQEAIHDESEDCPGCCG